MEQIEKTIWATAFALEFHASGDGTKALGAASSAVAMFRAEEKDSTTESGWPRNVLVQLLT